jgi:tetratricopeptide (TPR) repeat protein
MSDGRKNRDGAFCRIALLAALTFGAFGCKTTMAAKKAPSADKMAQKGVMIPIGDGSYLLEITAPAEKKGKQAQAKGDSLDDYIAVGDWVGAEEQARKRLKAEPGNRAVLKKLTIAMAAQGKYHEAAAYAEFMLGKFGQDADALNILGTCQFLAEGDLFLIRQRALGLLKEAYKKSEKNVAAGINLGTMLVETGQAKAAVKFLPKVHKACGGCRVAGTALARAYVGAGEFKKADEILKRIVSAEPRNFEVLYLLAVVNMDGLGDLDKAKDYLENIQENGPKSDSKMQTRVRKLVKEIEKRE